MSQAIETAELILEMDVIEDGSTFASSIEIALTAAENEMQSFKETINSIQILRPNCDKLDYALAASSGVLCGIMDIFLVGKP